MNITDFLDDAQIGIRHAEDLMAQKIQSAEDLRLVHQFAIARRIGIGMFDPYFAERTDVELALEARMYSLWDEKVYREGRSDAEKVTEHVEKNVDDVAKKDFADWKFEEEEGEQSFLDNALKDWDARAQGGST